MAMTEADWRALREKKTPPPQRGRVHLSKIVVDPNFKPKPFNVGFVHFSSDEAT